jgi:probable phosphoglycerate mutase
VIVDPPNAIETYRSERGAPVELLLIRHAQSESNVHSALDTAHPGADLTPRGERQVASLAKRLEKLELDAVWCSPRLRTRRTAWGLAEPRGLNVTLREGLSEVTAGEWEMSTDPALIPQYTEATVSWAMGNLESRIPGGETGVDALERFDTVIREIVHQKGERVAVVTHGAIARLWCGHVPNAGRLLIEKHPLRNTGLILVHGMPGTWRIREWDQQFIDSNGAAGAAAQQM